MEALIPTSEVLVFRHHSRHYTTITCKAPRSSCSCFETLRPLLLCCCVRGEFLACWRCPLLGSQANEASVEFSLLEILFSCSWINSQSYTGAWPLNLTEKNAFSSWFYSLYSVRAKCSSVTATSAGRFIPYFLGFVVLEEPNCACLHSSSFHFDVILG